MCIRDSIENMPSFVPIMFELTVFFAAHLMVITFYLRSKMWPFKTAENPDPRTTDDHFLIEISVSEVTGKLKNLLKNIKIKLILFLSSAILTQKEQKNIT